MWVKHVFLLLMVFQLRNLANRATVYSLYVMRFTFKVLNRKISFYLYNLELITYNALPEVGFLR